MIEIIIPFSILLFTFMIKIGLNLISYYKKRQYLLEF